jgi:nuclear GTP-binding protein
MDAAGRIILRDWAYNTFPHYSTPPKPSPDMEVDGDRQDMSRVLESCKTRKEMRAVGRGLVRFKGGEVDLREVGFLSLLNLNKLKRVGHPR